MNKKFERENKKQGITEVFTDAFKMGINVKENDLSIIVQAYKKGKTGAKDK